MSIENVQNMLDLSAAHLPNSNPPFEGVRVVEHEHGYVVFVNTEWLADPDIKLEVSEWLGPIMRKAAKYGCILINFDSDASIDDEFKTYEW